MQIVSVDELVPDDHLLRKVEAVMDWSFIYPLVEENYSADTGCPSLDPVVLVKMAVIQYLFGIRSMRQTAKEIEVNNAYCWFLGLDLRIRCRISRPLGRMITDALQTKG